MEGSNTLDRWERGQPIAARKLNEVVDEVNRLSKGVNAPVQKASDAKGSSAIVSRQFQVSVINENYLVCVEWDGTAAGTATFNIAKPYLLRKKPFEEDGRNGFTFVYGASQTRTATNSEAAEESQTTVPSYVAGDIIYGMKGVKGGVGLVDSINNVDEKFEWVDMNIDGRAWAKVAA